MVMDIKSFPISGILTLTPKKFEDDRGFLVETFRQDSFDGVLGENITFVQENHSFSAEIYTVRGLHAQSSPRTQGKLVQCTRGRIVDVVVDVRIGSSTYGQSIKIDMSAQNTTQLWIPAGFLHGFVTLEHNTEVRYKCTDYYAQENAINVFWNDADLNIDWGFDPSKAILSKNDRNAESFGEFDLRTRE